MISIWNNSRKVIVSRDGVAAFNRRRLQGVSV